MASGLVLANAIDCPDGLARCSGGNVEASKLAAIPQPCRGIPEQCQCQWERVGDCDRGCAADDVVVIVDRPRALAQLCAPSPEAGALLTSPVPSTPSDCDEEALYRCASGLVVSCADHAVVARCTRGCSVEGADLGGDEKVSREAAFAILCSR